MVFQRTALTWASAATARSAAVLGAILRRAVGALGIGARIIRADGGFDGFADREFFELVGDFVGHVELDEAVGRIEHEAFDFAAGVFVEGGDLAGEGEGGAVVARAGAGLEIVGLGARAGRGRGSGGAEGGGTGGREEESEEGGG